jgi:hypothetical protein
MSIVLAALDATAAARAVLETAIQIGRLTGTEVEALHVRGGHSNRSRHWSCWLLGATCRSGCSRLQWSLLCSTRSTLPK